MRYPIRTRREEGDNSSSFVNAMFKTICKCNVVMMIE
jgi:hypothetical protein